MGNLTTKSEHKNVKSHVNNNIKFNSTCLGSNIKLSEDDTVAERITGFNNGIIFSDRKLEPYEKIQLKIRNLSDSWEGELRVGFTSVNPNSIPASSLPKFCCPDLNFKKGYWARALRFPVRVGTVLEFHINKNSDCYLNNKIFATNICGTPPIWLMIDVYGKTTSVEIRKKCYDPECLLKINDDLNELTCAVCFDRSPDTKLLPCGHDLFCKTCIFKIKLTQNNCPVCRSNIDQIIFL